MATEKHRREDSQRTSLSLITSFPTMWNKICAKCMLYFFTCIKYNVQCLHSFEFAYDVSQQVDACLNGPIIYAPSFNLVHMYEQSVAVSCSPRSFIGFDIWAVVAQLSHIFSITITCVSLILCSKIVTGGWVGCGWGWCGSGSGSGGDGWCVRAMK